jgi:hypothetical protein
MYGNESNGDDDDNDDDLVKHMHPMVKNILTLCPIPHLWNLEVRLGVGGCGRPWAAGAAQRGLILSHTTPQRLVSRAARYALSIT